MLRSSSFKFTTTSKARVSFHRILKRVETSRRTRLAVAAARRCPGRRRMPIRFGCRPPTGTSFFGLQLPFEGLDDLIPLKRIHCAPVYAPLSRPRRGMLWSCGSICTRRPFLASAAAPPSRFKVPYRIVLTKRQLRREIVCLLPFLLLLGSIYISSFPKVLTFSVQRKIIYGTPDAHPPQGEQYENQVHCWVYL